MIDIFTDIMIERIIELKILSSEQINDEMKNKINNLTKDLINTYDKYGSRDIYPPMILESECKTNIENIQNEMVNNEMYYENTINDLKYSMSELQNHIWDLEREIEELHENY